MSRWSPNRQTRRATPPRIAFNRLARRALEAVFWMLLLLAAGIGGPGALEGLPKLADLVTPSGVLEAQASTKWEAPAQVVFQPLTHVAPTPVVKLAAAAPLPAPQPVKPVVSTPKAKLPLIALVIDDMGGDIVQNRRAIALPKEVSLSFLPYPEDTPRLARSAREAGHQILVHVPMEAPRDRDGSLKNALRRDLPVEENLRRLDEALSRVEGYAGINNHEGSVFTADRHALVPVAEALYGRGMFFLDSRTTPLSQVVAVSRAFGVPSADRDIFLDDDQASPAVAHQLKELERVAREQGVAIAIGHPHAATLDLVTRWCAELKGYRLIKASDAIRLKTELDVGVEMASK
ncbi:MAG: divergent polysaccharide deacetylase family protein [Rhizomicrobium sp.]|nr:divergent polysaccharide deacetylase family protein [Rhizomicrobium sp.]